MIRNRSFSYVLYLPCSGKPMRCRSDRNHFHVSRLISHWRNVKMQSSKRLGKHTFETKRKVKELLAHTVHLLNLVPLVCKREREREREKERKAKWQCAREATNEICRKFFIPTPMASVCYGSQREKIPVSDTEGPCISFARTSPTIYCT